jgi:hypothetical protein
MLFQSLSIAALIAALPTSLALPEVTIKALPADCSSYPQYNKQSATAGPWIVQLRDSDNAALEGYGDSIVDSYSIDPATQRPIMYSGHVSLAELVIEVSSN